jgi:branched-chain amino acid transport system ATP-binding protein
LAPPEPAASTVSADGQAAATERDLLLLSGVQAGYGRKHVVFDVDLHVGRGEIVTIVGHNGAGKTTTLKTVFGMLRPLGGNIVYDGDDVARSSCRRNVLRGMSYIPAERFVFGDLNVIDNLRLGGMHHRDSKSRDERLALVYEMFPILRERSEQKARTMSGGQQRMLSLGLAMMSRPRLLLLDEPSLGLAPALVGEIFNGVRRLADEEGLSVLLLEQNVGQVLRIADRAYVMRSGRIILEETAAQMQQRPDYWDLF